MMERRWDGGGDGMFGGTPAFRSPTLDRLTAPPGAEKKTLLFCSDTKFHRTLRFLNLIAAAFCKIRLN